MPEYNPHKDPYQEGNRFVPERDEPATKAFIPAEDLEKLLCQQLEHAQEIIDEAKRTISESDARIQLWLPVVNSCRVALKALHHGEPVPEHRPNT